MHFNYQHLYYFWVVARAPSLTAAARRLSLAPSTISAQIKNLEATLERPLFERRGRGLTLTEHGRVVLTYADDIFSLGEELLDATRSHTGPRHAYRLRVGVSNNLPKLVAYQLLAPACDVDEFPVHLVCLQGEGAALVASVAVHHLDLVVTDAPVGLSAEQRMESRLLGQCGVALMAAPRLAERYQQDFPACLERAPLLLPDPDSTMRRLLEGFFQARGIRPQVVAEFADSGLLKAFGERAAGIFPIPKLVLDDVRNKYNVVEVGTLEGVQECFYASYLPGREANPAIAAVLSNAVASLAH